MARLSSQLLLPSISLFVAGKGLGQDALRYRFQWYDEDHGRMEVESHYLDLQYGLTDETSLGLRLAVDSLSGMTPTGSHARNEPDNWNYADIEDERVVGVVTIDHEIGDHTLSFEYARSEEDDYLSDAFSLRLRSELFEDNTTITAGVSVELDKILNRPFFWFDGDPNKDTVELTLGVSQLLSTRTILDVTFGYAHADGFLSDPYRAISRIDERGRTRNTPENRPDKQDRYVAKVAARHAFPDIDAALSGSYRFFANSDDLEGHTFELKWIQQVTEELSITPYFRYYQQSSADYYYSSLTGTGIVGVPFPTPDDSYYSADYRLAALDAITYGIRFAYEPRKDLTVDLQFERYEMSGRKSDTPSEFFPTANVVSLGVQWSF